MILFSLSKFSLIFDCDPTVILAQIIKPNLNCNALRHMAILNNLICLNIYTYPKNGVNYV